MRTGVLLALGLQFYAGLGVAIAGEPSVVAGVEQRERLDLTLYQNGPALVNESRIIAVSPGSDRIVISGTSPRLIPGSVQVIADGLSVRALNYRLDGLTPRALLAASVGKQVGVTQTHPATGEETVVPAQVLSVEDGIVLRINNRIETGVPGRLVFDHIPADLANSPAVVVLIDPGTAYDGAVGIRYLSGGLGWRADHTVNVTASSSGVIMDMESWASIENNTGVAFNNASLALVAGSVNRTAQPQPWSQMRMETMSMAVMADGPATGQPVRETLGDFHLYSVPGSFDLQRSAHIRILLGTRNNIAAEKAYILRGHDQAYSGPAPGGPTVAEHPQILYRFTNASSEPMAAGIVRLYGADSHGTRRFLGEDRLPATAAGDLAEIHGGQAFNLSARRRQTGFKLHGSTDDVFETSRELTLRNAGAQAAIVEIREPVSEDWSVFRDWEILESSHESVRDGMTAVWKIPVPAGGEAVLRYRVRIMLREP